jgi:hypothetical protein
MSDHSQPASAPADQPLVAPPERVLRGLLAALVAVLLGVALTVVIWRAGYVAAITSLAIAFGASYLYTLAAGRSARRGLVPLILLILLGVVVAFFAIVVSDLFEVYDDLGLSGSIGRGKFVRENVFDPDLLKSYDKDLAWFAGFALLGIFGTIRQLFASRAEAPSARG